MQVERKVLQAGIVAALLAFVPAAGLAGEPITVIVDRAKVMHVSRPADVVIIGNPAIADATIQDNQTLIITGRSFGTTNLIVLDSAGNAIADENITVQAANDDVVTIYKRASRQTYSCTPDCSPVVTIGDNSEAFSTTRDQVNAHSSLSSDASAK
ncbi:MAG TPA: pilus assembly protein N-terminal domain-containing protein [Bauldia sp.]|nr:pilus assembly protein N-terminal domain-containing protein [Bauldia sp.]